MTRTKRKIKILLVLILVFNVLLRLPSLFDPVSYGDECIYLTLGNAFNRGLVFYRDIHDNKPPLLYFFAALAQGRQFYFRLITIIWNTVNVWLIYKLAKLLLQKEKAGLVAALLFVFFSLLPEGRIANGEIFMIMPATLGVFISLKGFQKKKDLYFFLAGFCFSLGFLFKVPAVLEFMGFILALFVFTKLNLVFNKRKPALILGLLKDKRFVLLLTSFFLPILLSIIYYWTQNASTPYIRSALLQNIGYLSSWAGASKGLYQRLVILLLVGGLIYSWHKRLTLPYFLPALMFLFGLYGVFLSERPYPHYFMQVAPWAALLLTVTFWLRKKEHLIITFILLFLGFAGVIKFDFWWYSHLPYYRNFLRFARGEITRQQYFAFFGTKVLNDYQIAKYLKAHTKPDQPVFIWGDGACIYTLSGRLPSGRYTVNYHIYDFNGYKETLKAIEEKRTPTIVMLESAQERFPQLESLLAIDYVLVRQIGKAEVYQRLISE